MDIPTIPNNSLTEEIKEIIRLCGLLEPEYGEDALLLNPPATEDEIIACEKRIGISIPESYKEWLRFSNGSEILSYLAVFFDLNRIGKHDRYVDDGLVAIGEIIGDGEYICFSKSTGRVVRFNHGNILDEIDFRGVLLDIIELLDAKL